MADDRPILRKKTPYHEVKRPDHPLASADGSVLLHRAILYDTIGLGPHPCCYCGRDLNWYARLPISKRPEDYLVVEHKDSWSLNNDPSNLAPCCGPCNNSKGCKNQKLWDELRRTAIPRPIPKSRYRKLRRVGHPLATSDGHVAEHRFVLYEKIGPGEHPCHWCGKMLRWTPGEQLPDSITPDHLDSIKRNNVPDNLVPSCQKCNSSRTHHENFDKRIKPGDAVITLKNGHRIKAVESICAECGFSFAHPVKPSRRSRGKFCSKHCAVIFRYKHRPPLPPGIFLLPTRNGKNVHASMANCKQCGSQYPRPTFKPPDRGLFCSRRCATTWDYAAHGSLMIRKGSRHAGHE
jgi:hypothetical protein